MRELNVLCDASETNEKLSWKLVKSQCSSSQMSAFSVDGKMITDKTNILNMWVDHFIYLFKILKNLFTKLHTLKRGAEV